LKTIILSSNEIKDNVNTVLIVFYIFFSFLSLYGFQETLINSLIVLLGVYLLFRNFNYIKNNHFKLFFVCILFAVYSIVCLFLFQDRVTYTPIRVMVHFALFIAVLRYNINPKAIKWLLYMYIIYIFYLILIQNVYINNIFPESSKNIVGWFGLGICTFYYYLEVNKRRDSGNSSQIDLLPVVLTLSLCLITLGRSNIACAFLLLIVVLWYNFKVYSFIKKITYLLILTVITALLIYMFYEVLESGFQRFDQKGFESYERDTMRIGYFDKLDFYTFLLGINANQYPFTILNSNFHNSFLGGHSSFGIMFMLFIGYIIQLFFRNFIKSFILVMLALVLLIRSYTDGIMFIGYFDFVLLTILFKIKKN